MQRISEFLSVLNDEGYSLLDKEFTLDCDDCIFSVFELNYLLNFGHLFQALSDGLIEPKNDMQARFVKVCKREETPFAIYEWAWVKYLDRHNILRRKREMEAYFKQGST